MYVYIYIYANDYLHAASLYALAETAAATGKKSVKDIHRISQKYHNFL